MKISHAKIGFFIFAIILVAGFYVVSSAQENSTSDKNIFLDSDQDGLSDDEEKTYGTDPNEKDTDGDGYSDGTEIKGGYDPLKPAPGDKIIVDTKPLTTDDSQQDAEETNLTNELSTEIATLVSERSSEQQDITLDDLDTIIEKTTGEVLTFDDLPLIEDDEIKTKDQKYSRLSDEKRKEKMRTDALEYLTAVSYVIANNMPQKINSPEDYDNFVNIINANILLFSSSDFTNISYFQDLAEKNENILAQISEVEVPEEFIDVHKKGMQISKYAISLKNEISPDPEDPISMIVNMSKVQNIIGLGNALSNEIITSMNDLGIEKIPL